MCNRFHSESSHLPEQIPKEGVFWKFFVKDYNGKLHAGIRRNHYEHIDNEGYVTWDIGCLYNPTSEVEYGFCGFSTKKEAQEVLKEWKMSCAKRSEKLVIRKCLYKGGIGSCLEFGMVYLDNNRINKHPRIVLVKKFKLAINRQYQLAIKEY